MRRTFVPREDVQTIAVGLTYASYALAALSAAFICFLVVMLVVHNNHVVFRYACACIGVIRMHVFELVCCLFLLSKISLPLSVCGFWFMIS